MNMAEACWMSRSIGQSISSVCIDENNDFLVGGWDGEFRKYSRSGDLLWTTTLPDRVGAIEVEKSSVFVTSGLHIVCLDATAGQIVWQHALEGSADDIIVYQTRLYAISSVYDIEHNDFIDSAIWCFSKSGEKQWDTHLDERPWVILPTEKQITVGLGRPKMGNASVSKSGKLQYHQPIVESPITSGCMRQEGPLFAHADGHITDNESKLLQLDSAIESIISHNNAFYCITDSGKAIGYNDKSEQLWSMQFNKPNLQTIGFVIGKSPTYWLAISDGINGNIQVLDSNNGEMLCQLPSKPAKAIHSNSDFVIIGFEDGEIMVWQRELFERRLNSTETNNQTNNEHRKSMKDKLRALRER